MKKKKKTSQPEAAAKDVELVLRELSRPGKAEFLPGFFRAIPGGYGEGDQFLGVIVPDQRQIEKDFRELSIDELGKLLRSYWHECRLTAIFILVNRFEAALRKHRKLGQQIYGEVEETPQGLVGFYLENLEGVNNWDLVDSSAYKILGAYLVAFPKQKKTLNPACEEWESLARTHSCGCDSRSDKAR
ncbi:MAG: DNA alkylation repair protein [Planctomycetota bacterium]|nr:DNA alkylation repair protein [Planctomycetota bacterium]